ncbi:MAG: hypothetical protein JWQ21_1093 [Herminiimonas sp.]|nr:hypothetical protein [Herminiimonas sp.]
MTISQRIRLVSPAVNQPPGAILFFRIKDFPDCVRNRGARPGLGKTGKKISCNTPKLFPVSSDKANNSG